MIRRRARLAGVDGFLTVQHVAAVAMSLVLVTMLANLIVFQYGRSIVRSALDDAARAGARVTASPEAGVAACATVAARTRADLLGGAMGVGLTLECGLAGGRIVATATGAFPGWLPGIPDLTVEERASAARETRP